VASLFAYDIGHNLQARSLSVMMTAPLGRTSTMIRSLPSIVADRGNDA